MSYVGWLVRPLVQVCSGVEKVYVCVDKREYAAVMAVLMKKAFDWVEVLGSMRVCPVGWRVFDGPEVGSFVL